eukprot:08876_6
MDASVDFGLGTIFASVLAASSLSFAMLSTVFWKLETKVNMPPINSSMLPLVGSSPYSRTVDIDFAISSILSDIIVKSTTASLNFFMIVYFSVPPVVWPSTCV